MTINNPSNVSYVARLPGTAFDSTAFPEGGNVEGQIVAQARPDGIGVVFSVQFSNLPKTGVPFTYHIHTLPVPADGNCTAAGGHLDPFQRGDDPTCDSELKQTCQVGDLSGKHGKITADPFNTTYHDLFASTDPANAAFFGNLSFVLHYPNKTRITCANFVQEVAVQANKGSNVASVMPTGTGAVTGSAAPYKTDGGSFVTVSAATAGAGLGSAHLAALSAGIAGVFVVVILGL